MLIDFIDSERLPFFIVWLDWVFYAYKIELIIFLACGVAGWIIFCWFRYGYMVG